MKDSADMGIYISISDKYIILYLCLKTQTLGATYLNACTV